MIELLQRALSLHQQGRLDEAADAYQNILKIQPRNVDALGLFGLVCRQRGAYQESQKVLKKCLKIKPDFAQVHAYLGDTLSAMGDFAGAQQSFKRAVSLSPKSPGALSGLGHALLRLGRYDEALDCCQASLAIDPDSIETQNLLGVVLMGLGRNLEAEGVFRRCLSAIPDHAPVLGNLGNVLANLGLHVEAEKSFKRAIELAPDFLDAQFNLGLSFEALKRNDEAEACFRKVLALNPSYGRAWWGLAKLAIDKGLLDEAEDSCRKAIKADPTYVAAHTTLCETLCLQGRFSEAVASAASAVRFDPEDFTAHSSLLFSSNFLENDSLGRGVERARHFGKVLGKFASAKYGDWKASNPPDRLRVGFVSGDLRNHPVGFFLASVLEQIDSSRVELLAYPTLVFEDDLTARIRPYFSEWKPLVGKTTREAAQLIHDDGVHILVDLSGHTAFNHLPVFALKPAPVQVSWLGYFSTTGVAEIDYLLADEMGVPLESRAHFTENIWYLPDSRLCYSAPDFEIDVGPLPALQNGFITFGSFQVMSKIGDRVLEAWSKVLAAVPGSRLRLQSKHFAGAALNASFLARCLAFGIDPARLVISSSQPRRDYLAAHKEIDLILDTFPYPGGTTTCDALWMGVPTLTLLGNTLLARQGASLLSAANLPEWIAQNESDYVEKAIAFASDVSKLSAVRASLREHVLASSLFDARRFAQALENALWGMWHERMQVPISER